MRQSALWDNLLIVFMPDHSSDFNEYTEQHPDRNRIPMIWTGGAVGSPGSWSRYATRATSPPPCWDRWD